MDRLKRITAINVNPFLTKIDFHVAKNTKILTLTPVSLTFSKLLFFLTTGPQNLTFPDRMNPV